MAVLKRAWSEYQEDQISFVSASVAFYLMLGFVPLIGAIVSIYGLVADPADVPRQMAQFSGLIPAQVLEIIETQLVRVSESRAAGLASVVSIALALWGGSKAMEALMTGLNIAYDEKEKRKFIRRKLTSLGLTLATALVAAGTVAVGVIVPIALHIVQLSGNSEIVIKVATWIAGLLMVVLWTAILYRFGPSRDQAKWRWISWGATFSAVAWLLFSAGFSMYVSQSGKYESSYGPLGAIVILLLWFYFTGLVMLFGAEINAELELQTAKDTTVGKSEPRGKRGAFVADHVPEDAREGESGHPIQKEKGTAGSPSRTRRSGKRIEHDHAHLRWPRGLFTTLILVAMVRRWAQKINTPLSFGFYVGYVARSTFSRHVLVSHRGG